MRHFGPVATMRFDPHPRPVGESDAHGVMYVVLPTPGVDPLAVGVKERFGTGVLDRYSGEPRVTLWTPSRPLRLLDLGSTWLARSGGTTALFSGPRGVARHWARKVHRQLDVDGMVWTSNVLPPGRCAVLFESAVDAVPTHPSVNRDLADPGLRPALARIARDYGLTLV